MARDTRHERSAGSSPPRRRGWTSKLLALVLGCLIAVALLELFLRWYDPLALRIKGSRVVLPISVKTVVHNRSNRKVDREIVIKRNRLGFRGPEPPASFDRYLNILTVGGSTTECFYLSDGKTWTDRLQQRLEQKLDRVWLNNAGLDGHSTFGHHLLLTSYVRPLRPKVVVYLVGLNDVANDSQHEDDATLRRLPGSSFFGELRLMLNERFAIAYYVDNLIRHWQAKKKGLIHNDVYHEELILREQQAPEVTQARLSELLSEHRSRYLPAYERRLRNLVRETRDMGARPVLITQPALYGPSIDEVTHVDLGKILVGDGLDGNTTWRILELYNDVTRLVGQDADVPVIELAEQLPKNSTFYYDFHHFTNAGAEQVARIVYEGLWPYLAQEFPQQAKRGQGKEGQ